MKKSMEWFVESRFGMFIHWGLYSMPGRHEWIQNFEQIVAEDYKERYFTRFDPDLYDPALWARLAREAGMKYVVITTKHHEGFCLWDSKHTDFKATNTAAGCDLVRSMIEAFRNEGIRIGFYYSLIDWHHPEFPIDRHHPEREKAGPERNNRDVKKYTEYLHDQVRELLTEYGKIDLMWFDFSYPGEDGKGRDDWQSGKLIKMVRELQPGIMVNNRLDLPERADFYTPEQYMPSAWPMPDGEKAVWEGCHTFSGSWGYHRDESSWKSARQCIWMLVDSVGKGGNLLMNVGPTARGEFDHRAVDRLRAYTKWMKYHRRSIYGCTAAPDGFVAPVDTRLTYNPETHRMYIHILNWPFGGLHLPSCFEDRIEYAQLLNDGTELLLDKVREKLAPEGSVELETAPAVIKLPVAKPDVEIPVIELFMK